jgi:hypothetical protein
MWDQLPNHFKTGMTVALCMAVGVAAAGFVLSFVALREVAANPVTGWSDRVTWIFPFCLDAALITAEVIYIVFGMVRGQNRALPLFFMLAFAAATVWFNVERVPVSWRPVTAIPPVAGVCMTLLIGSLLKVFARMTGRALTVDAPPSYPGVVYGSIRRGDETDIPSWAPSAIGQNGQPHGGGETPTKRLSVEAYLDEHDDGNLTVGRAWKGIRAAGLDVSQRYVGDIMAARKHSNGSRS